jgi:hypothetical protein
MDHPDFGGIHAEPTLVGDGSADRRRGNRLRGEVAGRTRNERSEGQRQHEHVASVEPAQLARARHA